MPLDLLVLEEGSFYFIKDGKNDFILEDKTKRGLAVKETSIDEKLGIKADKGMIHDMDGIGHPAPIRWYFSKDSHDLPHVVQHAKTMEEKYTRLRELTCPDGDD